MFPSENVITIHIIAFSLVLLPFSHINLFRYWRLWTHRCQPNTVQMRAFGRRPRHAAVSAFGPAAMRPQPGGGAGEKPPLPSPQDRPDCRVPGRQAPAISQATAAGLPGGQHGTQRMQKLAAGLRAYRRGPALFWLRRRLRADRRDLFPTCPNEAVSAEQNGRARRRGRRRPRDTAGRKRGTEKNEHG